MPSIPSNSTILVTGANGFIAMWVVDALLKHGYAVRAAVRSESRGQNLLETFKAYGDKIQLTIVKDLAVPGAFDEAVKDVEGIAHTAAITVATVLDELDADDIIASAVQGNFGLLTSAQKYGTSLKRIVITSSAAARAGSSDAPQHIDDNSWNNEVVDITKKLGKAAPGLVKYAAAKTEAERSAWKWYEANKASITWDLTTLSPPWVFGPVLQETKTPDDLNLSNDVFYKAIIKGEISPSPLTSPSAAYVDSRDLGELHARAFEAPGAGGEGILTLAAQFVWQDAIDAVNSLSPSPWPSHNEPFQKGLVGKKVYNQIFDTSKEKRILKLKFRPIEETVRDILADYEKHGWA